MMTGPDAARAADLVAAGLAQWEGSADGYRSLITTSPDHTELVKVAPDGFADVSLRLHEEW